MPLLFCALIWSGCILGECGGQDGPNSFLYQPAYCLDECLREPAEPYVPQPGDLFLAKEHGWKLQLAHCIALIGSPHHSGIVVVRPDGSLALLEAAPFDTLHVAVSDLLPHLNAYASLDKVWIRRRRVPLTAEQSAQLTAFAMAQEGKPFALFRVLMQGTPFRSRGPLRTWWMGKPKGDRCAWFCSELVMEACVAVGLVDRDTARPAATFPRDLFFSESRNLYLDRHLHLDCGWYAPARWVPYPGFHAAGPS